MRENPRWNDLIYAIVKVLQDKFLNESSIYQGVKKHGIYTFENLFDPEKVDIDFLDRLYEVFNWPVFRQFEQSEAEIRAELLGVFSWFRKKYLIQTYYSIFYSLGLKVDFKVLWTGNLINYIPTEWKFIHSDLYTDLNLLTDTGLTSDNLIATPHIQLIMNCDAVTEGNFFTDKDIELLNFRIAQIKPVQSTVLIVPRLDATMSKNRIVYTDDKQVVFTKSAVFQSLEFGDLDYLAEISWGLKIGFGEIAENDFIETGVFDRRFYDAESDTIIYAGSFISPETKYLNYYIISDIWGRELLRVEFPGIYCMKDGSVEFEFIIEASDETALGEILALVVIKSGVDMKLLWLDSLPIIRDSYSVYRGLTPGFLASPANQIASDIQVKWYTDTTTERGEIDYYYKIASISLPTMTKYLSNEVLVQSLPVIAPPENLYAENLEGFVTVVWSYNIDVDFKHYNLYRDIVPEFVISPTNLLQEGITEPGFIDETADRGEQNYYYKATAVDNKDEESISSNEGSIITIPYILPPEGLYAVESGTYILLAWDEVVYPDITGYNIYRSEVPGFTPSPLTLIQEIRPINDILSLEWLDESVVENVTYYYKITTVDGLGYESVPSDQESRTAPWIWVSIPTEIWAYTYNGWSYGLVGAGTQVAYIFNQDGTYTKHDMINGELYNGYEVESGTFRINGLGVYPGTQAHWEFSPDGEPVYERKVIYHNDGANENLYVEEVSVGTENFIKDVVE